MTPRRPPYAGTYVDRVFSWQTGIEAGRVYIQVLVISVPFAMGFNVYRSVLSALGDGRTVVLASIAELVVNCLASPILALGLGTMQSRGIWGIGAATVLANMSMFVIAATVTHARFGHLLKYRDNVAFELRSTRELLRVGWPAMMCGLLESGLFSTVLVLAGKYVYCVRRHAANYDRSTWFSESSTMRVECAQADLPQARPPPP